MPFWSVPHCPLSLRKVIRDAFRLARIDGRLFATLLICRRWTSLTAVGRFRPVVVRWQVYPVRIKQAFEPTPIIVSPHIATAASPWKGKHASRSIGSIKALPGNARSQFRPHPLARSTSISLNLDGIRCHGGPFSVISGAVAPNSPPIRAFRPQHLLPRPPGQQQSQWYGEFVQCRPNRPAGGGARLLGNRFGAAAGVI